MKKQESHEVDDEVFDDFSLGDEYEDFFHVSHYAEDVQSHSLAYMASILEAKILKGKQRIVKCSDCIGAFVENELLQDSFIRFKARRTNIMQPCKSTFDICKFVDGYVKSCEERSSSYQSVVLQILRKISFEALYTSTEFEQHDDKGHKYEFVKKIIEQYMHLKSIHIAKCFTQNAHKNSIRHYLKKIIHSEGQ